ncbi:MAG: nucleotide sugar dehydrogenase [bacterium]|nr:nucleotide sugar dehydrogenase [bacterium]MDZ4285093.1 nucleotide sugar dehydrogenase [Patescibacteria group bacterium]
MEQTKKSIDSLILSYDQTLGQALALMNRQDPGVSELPGGIVLVVDETGKLVGIATDGDIRRALGRGATSDEPLKSVMNPQPFTVRGREEPAALFEQVVARMREGGWQKKHFEKIVVIDRDGRPIDIVWFHELWLAADVRAKRVAVIGLGYVGLTLALTFADLGFRVVGFDTNAELTALVRRKKAPFFEEGIEDLLTDHVGKRFSVLTSLDERSLADVYIIAVGTPLDREQRPQLAHLKDAANAVGRVLKRGDSVILRSTVPLGTTRDVVVPTLEKRSGLKAGEDFFVAFAPERTVEGQALSELRSLPQVVGGINRASTNAAAAIFNLMTDTVIIVDTLEEAEMVKLVNNTYRDVTFAFANEVSLICRRWGIDTQRVISAANTGYPRSMVPRPSPGVGGYCLEKDPFLYIASAHAREYTPLLARDARETNVAILTVVADEIRAFLRARRKARGRGALRVGVLGLAFKGEPPTSDMRGSPTLELVALLRKERGVTIVGYDPVVARPEIAALGIEVARTSAEVFRDADAVIVMTNHRALRSLPIRKLLALSRAGVLLFDPWALYQRDEVMKVVGVDYRML